MDLQTIIKELRVDWDTVLTDEFNPLHIALCLNKGSIPASDFRDMYHKLENAMEEIIGANFKGFSDSVLSYNRFHLQNKELLKNLECVYSSAQIREFDYSINNITKEFSKSEYFGSKYELCRKIMDIKLTYEEYEVTTELIKKCYQLVKCLDLIDNKDFAKIKGVFEYRKLIYKSYLDLTDQINIKIFEFVFGNKINNSFKCLLILGSLYELETFVKSYFRPYLFNSIEDLILDEYKRRIDLERLCKKIMKKTDAIIKNYQTIIELTLSNFKLRKTEEDFFGNQNETYKYVTKLENILEIIKDELANFIGKYSVTTQFDNKFSLENIIDAVDYNKIYPNEYNIFKNRVEPSGGNKVIINTTKTQYTLITTPRIEVTTFLLKYAENPVIKIFLNKRVETEYTKFKLEKNKKKIDYIFEAEIKIDPKTKRLTLQKEIENILATQHANGEATNYDREIIKHLNNKIKKVAIKQFRESFKSEIVAGEQAKIFMYDGDKGGFIMGFDDTFKQALFKKYINKSNLLLKKSQYQKVIYTLNTFKDLDNEIASKEIADAYTVFFITFKKQINLEFFYYFDMYYREGNFKQTYCLKKIVAIFELIYNETKNSLLFDGLYDNLFYYCRNNTNAFGARNKDDVREFIKQIRILDEIMGEVEFYDTLQPLYDFYEDVLNDRSQDEQGKILQSRLRASGR